MGRLFGKFPWEIEALPFHQYVYLRAGYLDHIRAQRGKSSDALEVADWDAESVTTLAD